MFTFCTFVLLAFGLFTAITPDPTLKPNRKWGIVGMCLTFALAMQHTGVVITDPWEYAGVGLLHLTGLLVGAAAL